MKKHGDSFQGVDWPIESDVYKRYDVMLNLIVHDGREVSLLDFGCGTSHLYKYIVDQNMINIVYYGLDISADFIEVSKNKYPQIKYYCVDILQDHADVGKFDYVVMNGIFTEKRELSFDEMFEYFKRLVTKVFFMAGSGVAFNIMSSDVDWERDDLFHLPLNILSDFLVKNLTRNFVIRNDYGLYEYTVYLYK